MSACPHNDPSPTVPTLVGIGVGPGDPELLTLKAARLLAAADVVLVPATEASAGGAGRAEEVVLAAVPSARVQRIPFSMADRAGVSERRQESWQASAAVALEHFASGAQLVAFATIGDPSVYSTFSYLAGTVTESMPEVAIEVVPGITAMQSLAAASRTPLCEGTEVLALVPATRRLEGLSQVLEAVDSVCIYKGGRQLPALRAELARHDRQAVVGTNVSLPHQELTALDDLDVDATAPYFSAVLSTPTRTTTGGSL